MSKKTPSVQEHLAALVASGDAVEVERRIADADVLSGIVVASSAEWALLQLLDGRTILNGYAAVRVADILEVATVGEEGTESFVKRALAHFEQTPSAPDGVDITSLATLLTSAADVAHIVSLHNEWIDPDICYVGEPLSVTSTHVVLRDISPEAEWSPAEAATSHAVSDITRVDFGGRYEEALYALGRASYGA